MQHVSKAEAQTKINLLDTRINLNLSPINVRLIVDYSMAINYQVGLKDEPCLYGDGICLKEELRLLKAWH